MESKSFSSGQCPDNPEYNETLEWLYSQLPMFSRVGAAAYKPGLDNTLELDEYLGHPHRYFKTIHIAGTNGKGSTSHLLAAILQASGYKTGLYTSPHLVDFRERIRINGQMISHNEVIDFVKKWRSNKSSLMPSFFELTMMMAFNWFAKEKVDFAVIEVGMGGRLDSTNIISPIASVITNISKDHTQFLGETLPEIAREKAGIIKRSIPVIIGEAEGEVRKVFEDKAIKENAPIIFAEDDPLLIESRLKGAGILECKSKEKAYGKNANPGKREFSFYCPLAGEYQKKNIETVLHTVRTLSDIGVRIEQGSIKKGFENVISLTGFKGRWTVLNDRPIVIIDTGHNEAGLKYNFKRLREMLTENKSSRLHIVFGMVADKDIDHILDLLPDNARYYFTQASIPRALPAKEMAEKAANHGFKFPYYPTVEEAYKAALSSASPEDIIFVGGSTFIVADFLASLEK